jgi:hypothetical protein
MGGIASQEDTACPVAGCVAVMEPELRLPDRVAQSKPATGEGIGDRL